MPQPTFISSACTALNNTTSPKTLSVTVAVGDDLLVFGLAGDASSILGTPTGGSGFTWTSLGSQATSNNTGEYAWKATATVVQTFTLSVARTGTTTNFWGFGVMRFSGVTGYGTLAKTTNGSGAPSQALTTVEANSTIAMAASDWNAITGTRTFRTVNGFTPTVGGAGEVGGFNGDGANWGVSIGYWPDAGAAGSKTVGTTAPTGQKFTIIAVEVKGTAGGGTNYTANPADALGLTDTATAVQDFARAPGDTAGLTDALVVAEDFARTTDDAASLTDTATAAQGFARTAADSATLTDTVAPVVDMPRVPTDGAAISDTVTLAQDFARAPTDPEGITDTVTVSVAFVRAAADALSITDTVTADLTSGMAVTPSDPLALTDALTVTVSFSRAPADIVTLSDTLALAQGAQRAQGDDASLSDALTAAVGYIRAAVEALGMSDQITAILTHGSPTRDITIILGSPYGNALTVGAPVGDLIGVGDPTGHPLAVGEPAGHPLHVGEPYGNPLTIGNPRS